MFWLILTLILTIITNTIILTQTSPTNIDGDLNHIFVILFSIITGIFIYSLISILLLLVYLFTNEYKEIASRSHRRRGAITGITITVLMLLKAYELLDPILFAIIAISATSIEIILSSKEK